MGAARDSEDPAMTDRFDDAEPTHAATATAHLLDERARRRGTLTEL